MYSYRVMSHYDIDELLDLQTVVIDELKDKDYFRASTREMLSEFIENGELIGAYSGKNLIAYRLIYFPKNRADNLGFDLGFSRDDLQKVVHFETAIVHPKYRRNRLQVLLTKELYKHVNLQECIVCATCYTMNYPSLSNLIKMGLSIITLKHKYNSQLRFILSNKKHRITSDETISYRCNETQKIEDILKKGYFGVELIRNEDSEIFDILFQKASWM